MKARSCVVVADADERRLVSTLLRLLRSPCWLAFYVKDLLGDFAAGKPASPLAALVDAKRAQAARRALANGSAGRQPAEHAPLSNERSPRV